MHRIDTPTAQKDKFGAGKNGFTRGNPQTGTPATDLDDDYFDMLQEELAGVVEATGVNLEKSKHNQLLTALKALLLSRAHPFADIKADGAAAIAEALSNLGIVSASLTTQGLVRLTSSRVSGAEDIAATANAVAQNYTDIKVLQGKTNDATPTNKGIIRVSDSRTSTESGVAASSLATSQNYADMKGLFGQCGMKSRNLGVVYTNSQSFAIFVSVNAVLSDGSSFLSANVNVDGNSANFRGSQTTNLAGQRATIAFMVPAGATYIVQQFSGTVSDVTWVEVDKK
ncbi:TPA: integrase [Citrobacter freundii]